MENVPPVLAGAFAFLFGMVVGSFLNVVIYRLPLYESVVFPGSHCPNCNTAIKAYDNIPVISYVLLGGKCRSCRTPISVLYPAVELLVGILFAGCFALNVSLLYAGTWVPFLADLFFVAIMVPLIFIDLRHKLLPNRLTYPGLLGCLLFRAFAHGPLIESVTALRLAPEGWPPWAVALLGAAIGALVGGGSLWLVREAYWRLRHVEGMGLGDVKLMLMVGAFLGWQLTLLTIFVGSLIGSVVGIIVMRLKGGSLKMEIPFGVFLGPAALVALFFGASILRWYWGMYR